MTSRIELESTNPSLELSVADSDFVEVARGVGKLNAEVDPGLYQVRFQAGPVVTTKLISLAKGQVHAERDIRLPFPSAAPIEGSSTSHEFQRSAAQAASRTVPGGRSGVVLMVRSLRSDQEVPIDREKVFGLELLDARFERVLGSRAWQINGPERWATLALPLSPGGYVLRWTRTGTGTPQTLEQAVWVAEDWQTLIFIPNLADGPAPEWASIHLTEKGWDAVFDQRTSQALELALWGLREGRAVIPDGLLKLLLEGKFQNPMLGIIGAHALLLREEPDLGVLETVIGNLVQLVGSHPDVIALSRMVQEVREPSTRKPRTAAKAQFQSVAWPPILSASYTALIRADAFDPGAIEDRSPAEFIAARRVNLGTWTVWQGPVELPAPTPSARARASRRVQPSVERAQLPDALSADYEDPASARVAAYLTGVSQTRGIADLDMLLDKVSPQQIGLATGLPTGSVDRALADVRDFEGLPA